MRKFYGKVINCVGLHARPASIAVTEANRYRSDVSLRYQERTANMKSIIQVMKMSVPAGGEVEIRCEGEDEEMAAAGLLKILEEKQVIQYLEMEV